MIDPFSSESVRTSSDTVPVPVQALESTVPVTALLPAAGHFCGNKKKIIIPDTRRNEPEQP